MKDIPPSHLGSEDTAQQRTCYRGNGEDCSHETLIQSSLSKWDGIYEQRNAAIHGARGTYTGDSATPNEGD